MTIYGLPDIFENVNSKEIVSLELNRNQITIIAKALELFSESLAQYSKEVTHIERIEISEILDDIKDVLLKF